MRRSEILGLRWRNVDLENNTFDVTEQLPFKVPPKTKVIEEMAPPKSNGRKLPITELARPFFLKQFAMQEAQREQAEKDGKPYYDMTLLWQNRTARLSLILSRLVDTFISRISLTMLPVPNPHNTVCVLSGEEARHWQSRSSGYSSS